MDVTPFIQIRRFFLTVIHAGAENPGCFSVSWIPALAELGWDNGFICISEAGY
jgi:hypothetical protein